MVRRIRWSALLAAGLVFALATTAVALVTYGGRSAIPGNYAYNYSNSLDYTGTPGSTGFRLHEAFVTDAANPAIVAYTRSTNGTTWTAPKKVSGTQSAEGSSLAAAGSMVVAGWMTGYSYYDADGAPRQVQVNVSNDGGATWTGVDKLSAGTGKVDYPIVAAGRVGTTNNAYVAWIDSANGNVRFRQSSNGGTTWSTPITLGKTTATSEGAAYGFSGYANIAAVGNLVSVAWIADNTGTLKVRSVNAAGVAAAPATLANWKGVTTLTDKISVSQNGFPILGASPQNPNVITIAYNTNLAQKFTTFTSASTGSATAAGTLIWTNGTVGANTYTGGYSTTVEPAPGGGFVAMWAGCRNTIAASCDYGNAKAKFDLLESSSKTGAAGTWSAPRNIEASTTVAQLNDEASIVVVPGATAGTVKVYAQYNAYKWNYTYYDVWMKIGTGTLG